MGLLNILFYGNCQSQGVIYSLERAFEANYQHIVNYEYIREKKELPIDLIKKADIFIYQPTKSKHGIYSTDPNIENGICSHLSPNCKKISFPYMYNSAMWCFVPQDDAYKDIEPIIKLKKEGYSVESIIDKFLKGEIDFEHEKRFNNCISTLMENESECDVKVVDFILRNIFQVRLFLTQNHPSIHLYNHCANQILVLLASNKEIKHNLQYDENMSKLPGNFAHTTYDVRFWNFKYPVVCWDKGWSLVIRGIYDSIKD